MNDRDEGRKAECDTALHWYALRVFRNRSAVVRAGVEKSGGTCFAPMYVVERKVGHRTVNICRPVFPSLLFVRVTKCGIERLCKEPIDAVGVYSLPGSKEPAVIPDDEMDAFIFVTTMGNRNLEAVDLSLAKGDRVRITGGPFEGVEGYVARVKNAKRFIVVVEGVAAVATGYIPKTLIEKIGV